jgi:hypothetical protein
MFRRRIHFHIFPWRRGCLFCFGGPLPD